MVAWSFSGSGALADVRAQLAEAIIRDVPPDDSEQSAALASVGQRIAVLLDTLVEESGLTDGAISGQGRYHDDGTFMVNVGLSAIAPSAVAQQGGVARFADGTVRDVGT